MPLSVPSVSWLACLDSGMISKIRLLLPTTYLSSPRNVWVIVNGRGIGQVHWVSGGFSFFSLVEMDGVEGRGGGWIIIELSNREIGIGTITLEIFVVQSMRDCISVSGRWFYGLFEEIVDLFTIKSTGNPKLTSSALGAFILIDDWLVGRLNDGKRCGVCEVSFGLKIFFYYISILFYYGGFDVTLTINSFIDISFCQM